MMAWAETKRQWEAWTAKKGMSKEEASLAFIREVRSEL
jgi:acyl-CoA-binding protein